jgi:hypothetical protein
MRALRAALRQQSPRVKPKWKSSNGFFFANNPRPLPSNSYFSPERFSFCDFCGRVGSTWRSATITSDFSGPIKYCHLHCSWFLRKYFTFKFNTAGNIYVRLFVCFCTVLRRNLEMMGVNNVYERWCHSFYVERKVVKCEIWGFQGGENSDSGFLGCDAMQTCRWLSTLWKNIRLSSSV